MQKLKLLAAATCGLSALGLSLLAWQWTPSSHGQPLIAREGSAAGLLATGNNDNAALDHFWCYDVGAQQNPGAPVNLKDQFTQQDVVVSSSQLFCNPVQKTHGTRVTRIRNRNGHLTLYVAQPPQPLVRQVIVSNQFGLQTLGVFGPRLLFVPTKKDPLARPRGLDHFWCYSAFSGQAPGLTVGLRDQFTEKTVVVGIPIFFCNPVRKVHNNVVTRIRNERGHLVCYAVSQKLFATTITVHNQFVDGQLYPNNAVELCVPSEKCEPQDDLDGDGLIDARETLLGTLIAVADSDGDGIVDGNDDANGNGVDDEDEDDNDGCPDRDSDGDGIDDEDEDD